MRSTDEIQIQFKDVKKMILEQNIVFQDDKIEISNKAEDPNPKVLSKSDCHIVKKNLKGQFIFYIAIMRPQKTLELLKQIDELDQKCQIIQTKSQLSEEKQEEKRQINGFLFITSNFESEKNQLKTDQELQKIYNCLSKNKRASTVFVLKQQKQIRQALENNKIEIVHFATHINKEENTIQLESLNHEDKLIQVTSNYNININITFSKKTKLEDMIKIFQGINHKPQVIFLNCCFSEQLFNKLQKVMKGVNFIFVDKDYEINDDTAIKFCNDFYQKLFSNQGSLNIKFIFDEVQLNLSYNYIKSAQAKLSKENLIKDEIKGIIGQKSQDLKALLYEKTKHCQCKIQIIEEILSLKYPDKKEIWKEMLMYAFQFIGYHNKENKCQVEQSQKQLEDLFKSIKNKLYENNDSFYFFCFKKNIPNIKMNYNTIESKIKGAKKKPDKVKKIIIEFINQQLIGLLKNQCEFFKYKFDNNSKQFYEKIGYQNGYPRLQNGFLSLNLKQDSVNFQDMKNIDWQKEKSKLSQSNYLILYINYCCKIKQQIFKKLRLYDENLNLVYSHYFATLKVSNGQHDMIEKYVQNKLKDLIFLKSSEFNRKINLFFTFNIEKQMKINEQDVDLESKQKKQLKEKIKKLQFPNIFRLIILITEKPQQEIWQQNNNSAQQIRLSDLPKNLLKIELSNQQILNLFNLKDEEFQKLNENFKIKLKQSFSEKTLKMQNFKNIKFQKEIVKYLISQNRIILDEDKYLNNFDLSSKNDDTFFDYLFSQPKFQKNEIFIFKQLIKSIQYVKDNQIYMEQIIFLYLKYLINLDYKQFSSLKGEKMLDLISDYCNKNLINNIPHLKEIIKYVWSIRLLKASLFNPNIFKYEFLTLEINSDIQNSEQQNHSHVQLFLKQLIKKQGEQATFNYFNSQEEFMKNSSIRKLKKQIFREIDFKDKILKTTNNGHLDLKFIQLYLMRLQLRFKFILENPNYKKLEKNIIDFSKKISEIMINLRECLKKILEKEYSTQSLMRLQQKVKKLYYNIEINYESIGEKMNISYINLNICDMIDIMFYQQGEIKQQNLTQKMEDMMINQVFKRICIIQYNILFENKQRFFDTFYTSVKIEKQLQQSKVRSFFEISVINQSPLQYQKEYQMIPKIIIIDAFYDSRDCFQIQGSKQFYELQQNEAQYNSIKQLPFDPSIKLAFLFSKSIQYLQLVKDKYNVVYLEAQNISDHNLNEVYNIFQQFIVEFLKILQDKNDKKIFSKIYHQCCQKVEKDFKQKNEDNIELIQQFLENIKFERNTNSLSIDLNLSISSEYYLDNNYLLQIPFKQIQNIHDNVQFIEFEEKNTLKCTFDQDLTDTYNNLDEFLKTYIKKIYGIEDLNFKLEKSKESESQKIVREDSGTQINFNFENIQNLQTTKMQPQYEELNGYLYSYNKQTQQNDSHECQEEEKQKSQKQSTNRQSNSVRNKFIQLYQKSQAQYLVQQNYVYQHSQQQVNISNNQENINSSFNLNTRINLYNQNISNNQNNIQNLQINNQTNKEATQIIQTSLANDDNQNNRMPENNLTPLNISNSLNCSDIQNKSLNCNNQQNNSYFAEHIQNNNNQNQMLQSVRENVINEDENEDKDDEGDERDNNQKIKNVQLFDKEDEEENEGNF
ncbi:hypothetical protein ABPG72_016499 [Tetrahymena utriculariae]